MTGNLSNRQFFHASPSEFKPGDLIQPGHRREGGKHWSDDYYSEGHHQFTWMTAQRPRRDSMYGTNHYEVEPTGLAEPYKWHEHSGLGTTVRADHPYAERNRRRNANPDQQSWVSLAPLRVIRKVADDEPRIGDTK